MKNVVVSKEDLKELRKHKLFDVQYPEDIIKAYDLITYEGENGFIYGSSLFSNLIYAGDVDIREGFEDKNVLPIAMKTIIEKVKKNPEYGTKYTFGDIKSGMVKHLAPLVKHIGYVKDGKIKGYNPVIFEVFRSKYKDLKLTEIPKLTDPNLFVKWLAFYKEVHNSITLRWTPEEISSMYKIADGGDIIRLTDSVQLSELDKIDLYFFSTSKGRFLEMTNVIFEEPPSSNEKIRYQVGLDALQMYYLKPQNLLKYLKRYYSFSRVDEDWKFMKVVVEFLNGNITMMNSINTDLKVLKTMLEFGYDVPNNQNYIQAHINNIIGRMANIFEADIPNEIFVDIKRIPEMRSPKTIIDTIKPINEFFLQKINEKTLKFLNDNKIPVIFL
jgi:hypothetical protein